MNVAKRHSSPELPSRGFQRVNVNLGFTSPKVKPQGRVRNQRQRVSHGQWRRLALEVQRKPPLVFQQEVAHRELDLMRRKEAPRAGVSAVSEANVVDARADQRALVFAVGAAEREPAVGIEFLWVGVVLRVP